MEEKRYQYYFDDEHYLLSYVHDVYSYRYHWHDDMYELHIILTGSMEFVREGQKYFLQPNDVIIVSPGMGHATFALEPQTATLVLRFSANAFEEFLQQDYICRFNFVSDSSDRQTVRYTHVRFYCAMLLQALAADDAYTGKIVRPTFELLLVTLFSRFESERSDIYQPKNKNIPDQLIQDVIQYIDENYAKKISLEELTEQFNYNRTYISTFFKKNVGMKFYDYLTRTRFSAAVWDLTTTDLSLTKIALYNGFPDLKTFNRLFQEMFHITPAEYRQKLAATLTKLPNEYWNVKELSDPNIKLKLDEFIGIT
ncbi:MAG: AraC family transcriptional regulator [Hungatella hathewayi]|nr:AraC family transcriptional regulator [Hungatella hathewayi]